MLSLTLTFLLGRVLLSRVVVPALMAGVLCISPIPTAYGQESRQQRDTSKQKQRQNRKNQQSSARDQQELGANKAGQNNATLMDEHAEDESPELGVIVGSCPGEGVCVLDTVWASPADEAGIVHGDYIMSIGDTTVSNPKELMDAIKQLKSGEKVKIKFWRQGETKESDVTLASKSDRMPEGQNAWLGVMLMPAEEGGVRIEQVVRNSPAEQAGLKRGDMIIKQGDREVKDVQSFVECVEDKGPDSQMQLTVKRDGREEQIDVTLGHEDDAPMQFMRESMRMPMDDMSIGGGNFQDSTGMIDQTLDNMRRRLRSLENELRELRGEGGQRGSTQRGDRQRDDDQVNDSQSDDFSFAPATSSDNGIMLVVDADDRWGNRGWNNRRWNDRGWNNNRGWNDSRWNDGRDWGNRYRSGYRSPLYRSPRYGNSYYRYGGAPYYRGGGSGFGRSWGRSGIQLGNFGVYWY